MSIFKLSARDLNAVVLGITLSLAAAPGVLLAQSVDFDGDGIPDVVDIDDDNDGILDIDEGGGARDTDGDLFDDSRDWDSDGDGIFDVVEAGANGPALDLNQDGMIDLSFPVGANGLANFIEIGDESGLVDYNGDGVSDLPRQTDRDEVPDFVDLDSDNDTALDFTESGGNSLLPVDSDGDGVADYRDLDSDNDGIPDIREVKGVMDNSIFVIDPILDVNVDGLDDNVAASPSPVPDSELDGTPDYLDLNSDNDPLNDVIEAGSVDVDGDNVVDGQVDLNGNGYHDYFEVLPLPVPDVDSDGIEDFREPNGDAPPPPPCVHNCEDTEVPVDTGTHSAAKNNVQTGLEGVGGCSVNPNAAFDPLLPLMTSMLLLHAFRHRIASVARKLIKGN